MVNETIEMNVDMRIANKMVVQRERTSRVVVGGYQGVFDQP
jgi:hypothetical protein